MVSNTTQFIPYHVKARFEFEYRVHVFVLYLWFYIFRTPIIAVAKPCLDRVFTQCVDIMENQTN